MQMNQISKDNSEIFESLHKGWFRRFCLKYLMMGGYTLGDYMNNSIVMMSFYHHTRLFEDTSYAGVKPGFYTRNQLIKAFTDAGYTKRRLRLYILTYIQHYTTHMIGSLVIIYQP